MTRLANFTHFCNTLYGRMIGSVLPLRWFAPAPLQASDLSVAATPIKLEIVSHCWQYSHLLIYQISSLINHPPRELELTYTLFYCPDDAGTTALTQHFDKIQIPGVHWNWQQLSKERLFRRAIGRNQAALASQADWLWFTDCDTIFHENCLDSVAVAVAGKKTRMVFPAYERITMMLPLSDDIFSRDDSRVEVLDIDLQRFEHNSISKAKGAFQIVHGDVARYSGYCSTVAHYQKPCSQWRKTYEDTLFRKLIDSQGEAVEIEGLYRIRHIDKGRYANSGVAAVRKKLRAATD